MAAPAARAPQPSLEIDVLVDAEAWNALEGAEGLAERAARAALAASAENFDTDCEMSITLTDDAHIRILNRDWRQQDKATNVLSFPAPDLPDEALPQPLGDVIVAYETLVREAEAEGKKAGDHLTHLVVHGTLHLLGYDHMNDQEAEEMEALEREILADLGISDPYALPQEP